MHSAYAIRQQIEATLAKKIPSALTPRPCVIRQITPTGVDDLDDVLSGGLPIGALSELVGPECSGRTSVALSFIARITQLGYVCAWLDVSNAFDPISAAASGVDLARVLWVRCDASHKHRQKTESKFCLPDKYLVPASAKKGLHGGGFGPHPRSEANNLSHAVREFLGPESIAPRCAEPQNRKRPQPQIFEPHSRHRVANRDRPSQPIGPWSRMEQAMRSADLLLQGGGFMAIVLDLGSITPECASRIPLATWHRYRAAAERTQSSFVLLSQYACAKSSAELRLRFQPGTALREETTVFTGMNYGIEVVHQRFTRAANIIPLRKPPHRTNTASWTSRTAWAACR